MRITYATSITVGIAILLVMWQAAVGELPLLFQQCFFAAMVFVCGVPHGALDHLVQREATRREKKAFGIKMFLARYLLLMLVYGVMWYWLPGISLLLFVAMACWHFGETDIAHIVPGAAQNNFWQAVYGAALLCFLLSTHKQATAEIIAQLLPNGVQFLENISTTVLSLLPVFSGAVLLIVLWRLRQKESAQFQSANVLQLIALLACCTALPLLPAFALYFAGWHSVVALNQIARFIRSKKNTQQQTGLLQLWKKALPFTALAAGGMLVGALLLSNVEQPINFLPVVFIFLSLITLPHMEVMHKLQRLS